MFLKIAKPFEYKMESGSPFANSEYYEMGDYKIHYRVDPAKTVNPVAKAFMVHGFGCNTRFFDEMVEQMTAAGISCLRVDLPDFGFSTRELPGINYIPQTRILHQMMEDFDEDGSGWILFGHSMGGSVAMDLTMQEKEEKESKEIAATVLYAPLVMADVPDFLRKVMRFKPLGKVLDLAMALLTPYDFLWFLVSLVMTFDVKYSKQLDPGVYRDPMSVKNMGAGLCYMTSVCTKPDVSGMSDVKVPVQLIVGGVDMFVMPPVARNMWKKMPEGASKKLFLSGGHCFLQNQNERTWKETSQFLKDNGLI